MIGKRRLTGFTLVEILVALMLTSMLTTLALAPVVRTVSRVVKSQQDYMDVSAFSRTISFIERDLHSAIRTAPNVINIIDHTETKRGDDDILMIMSVSPIVQNQSAGTLVYKIEEGGILHGDTIIPGLYRWVFPGRTPNQIDPEKLEVEDAQLVLPGLKQFRVEVPTGSSINGNTKNYKGTLPAGLYIKLSRKENDTTQLTYGTLDSKTRNEIYLNEYESTIVFP